MGLGTISAVHLLTSQTSFTRIEGEHCVLDYLVSANWICILQERTSRSSRYAVLQNLQQKTAFGVVEIVQKLLVYGPASFRQSRLLLSS